MFKNLTLKMPSFSSAVAKKESQFYKGWKVSFVLRENDEICFIYRPVKIFGKAMFFIPSGVWTNSFFNAMDYIDLKVTK